MKQMCTRIVMIPVRLTVEFKEDEGFFYATAPSLGVANFPRQSSVTVRSADKETAISEALLAAGYGAPTENPG
jgi:hypothetical protein